MRKYLVFLVVLLVVVSVAGPAQAQEKGQVGVTMAFPASVGLMFHPTDAIAVRPEFSFSTTSTDTTSSSGSLATSGSTTVVLGLSSLFYVRTWESLKAYFSPRFAYSRATSSGTGNNASATSTSEGTANAYSASGSVGAQYALSSRFSVFAETGIVFSWQKTSSSGSSSLGGATVTGSSEAKGHSWASRAGVGVILYF